MCAAFAENMISDTPTRVQPQTVHASQNKTTNPSLAAMQLNRVSPTTSLIRTKTLSSSQGTSDQLFPMGQAKKKTGRVLTAIDHLPLIFCVTGMALLLG